MRVGLSLGETSQEGEGSRLQKALWVSDEMDRDALCLLLWDWDKPRKGARRKKGKAEEEVKKAASLAQHSAVLHAFLSLFQFRQELESAVQVSECSKVGIFFC